jgi:hypothetical protein
MTASSPFAVRPFPTPGDLVREWTRSRLGQSSTGGATSVLACALELEADLLGKKPEKRVASLEHLMPRRLGMPLVERVRVAVLIDRGAPLR